jgi:hypothetical protein
MTRSIICVKYQLAVQSYLRPRILRWTETLNLYGHAFFQSSILLLAAALRVDDSIQAAVKLCMATMKSPLLSRGFRRRSCLAVVDGEWIEPLELQGFQAVAANTDIYLPCDIGLVTGPVKMYSPVIYRIEGSAAA